jgi:hypothetical protein
LPRRSLPCFRSSASSLCETHVYPQDASLESGAPELYPLAPDFVDRQRAQSQRKGRFHHRLFRLTHSRDPMCAGEGRMEREQAVFLHISNSYRVSASQGRVPLCPRYQQPSTQPLRLHLASHLG